MLEELAKMLDGVTMVYRVMAWSNDGLESRREEGDVLEAKLLFS